ncbi:mRNA-decapping enzyme 2, putative (DCP2) [Plasmodium ovale curtisi]|nr:mRNA-decapping enzyme 2, putative (DCP2) [Plasmodium ovale curtisi]
MNLIKGTNKMHKNSQTRYVNNNTKCTKIFSAHRIKQLAKDKKLLDDALLDCYGRFIALLPEFLLKDHVHLYFQIQEAYWWYDDMWQDKYPDKLPKLSLKTFGYLICDDCPILKKYVPRSAHEKFSLNWRRYCRTIPLRGAILLNHNLKKCLLVKGWSTDSWSFPKGKVDELEEDSVCACREIYEEIGIDIFPYIDEQVYIETHIEDQPIKLFIIPGVKEDTKFQPKTRKEIGAIRWFEIEKLLQYKDLKDKKDCIFENKKERINIWFVCPFIPNLMKWINVFKKNINRLVIKENTYAAGCILAYKYQITGIEQNVMKSLQNVDFDSKEMQIIGLLKSEDDLEEYVDDTEKMYKEVNTQMSHIENSIISEKQAIAHKYVNNSSKTNEQNGLFDHQKKIDISSTTEGRDHNLPNQHANGLYNNIVQVLFKGVKDPNGSAYVHNSVESDDHTIGSSGICKGSLRESKTQRTNDPHNHSNNWDTTLHNERRSIAKKEVEAIGDNNITVTNNNYKDSKQIASNISKGKRGEVEESILSLIESGTIGNKKVYEHVDCMPVLINSLERSNFIKNNLVLNSSAHNLKDMGNHHESSGNCAVENSTNVNKSVDASKNNVAKNEYNKTSIPVDVVDGTGIILRQDHARMEKGHYIFERDPQSTGKNACTNFANSGSKNACNDVNLVAVSPNPKVSISSKTSSNNKLYYENKKSGYMSKVKNLNHAPMKSVDFNFYERSYRYNFNKVRTGHLSALRLKEIGLKSFDDQDMDKRKNFRLSVYASKGKLNNGKKDFYAYKKGLMKNTYHSVDDASVYYVPIRKKASDACNDKTFGHNHANGWSVEDMFKLNEEKFGVHSTYNIEDYTTPLVCIEDSMNKHNRSGPNKNGYKQNFTGGKSGKHFGTEESGCAGGTSSRMKEDDNGIACDSTKLIENIHRAEVDNEVHNNRNSLQKSNAPSNLDIHEKDLKHAIISTDTPFECAKKSISSISSNISGSSSKGSHFHSNGLIQESFTKNVIDRNSVYLHSERKGSAVNSGGNQLGSTKTGSFATISGSISTLNINAIMNINGCIAMNDSEQDFNRISKSSNVASDNVNKRIEWKSNGAINNVSICNGKDNYNSNEITKGSISNEIVHNIDSPLGGSGITNNNNVQINKYISHDIGSVMHKQANHEKGYLQWKGNDGSCGDEGGDGGNLKNSGVQAISKSRRDQNGKSSSGVHHKSSNNYDGNCIKVKRNNNPVNKMSKSEYRNNIIGITNDNRKTPNKEFRRNDQRGTQKCNHNLGFSARNNIKRGGKQVRKHVIEKKEDHYSSDENKNAFEDIGDNRTMLGNVKLQSEEPGKILLQLIKGTSNPEIKNENSRNSINSENSNIILESKVKCLSEKDILNKFYNHHNDEKTKKDAEEHLSKGNIFPSKSGMHHLSENDSLLSTVKNLERTNKNRRNISKTYHSSKEEGNVKEENFDEMAMMEQLWKHLNSYNPFE